MVWLKGVSWPHEYFGAKAVVVVKNQSRSTVSNSKNGSKKKTNIRFKSERKPLRHHTEDALRSYFDRLNGHAPGDLYDLVLGEVEEPLLKAVMNYSRGNQSKAAVILGINRGTLRKKLKQYSLLEQ